MPRILVVEWTCLEPSRSELDQQGRAMLMALAHDLVTAQYQVVTMVCPDLGIEIPRGVETIVAMGSTPENIDWSLAGDCDYVIAIAPESDGRLWKMVKSLEDTSCQRISPCSDVVTLAGSKLKTNRWLRRLGLPAPTPYAGQPGDGSWIVKPDDGAGGLGQLRIDDEATMQSEIRKGMPHIESFEPGLPIGVSVLCGANPLVLPPVEQILSQGNYGEYVGGRYPVPGMMVDRGIALARRVVDALPSTTGWIGIDMVMDIRDSSSPRDVVIEINPRLTASYLVLRKVSPINLADAMIRIANGEYVAPPRWSTEPFEWMA